MRCCLLSLSPIADDPRVRRQGDALHALGWTVSAVGLPARRSPPPAWPIRTVDVPEPGTGMVERALRIGRVGLAGRCGPLLLPLMEGMPATRQLLAGAEGVVADLYVANDWTALPAAAILAARHGGRLVYDSHELAVAEREEDARWRLLYGRLAGAVEERFIRSAALVTTVSEGIADAMAAAYRLRERPVVIRNVPVHRAMPLRQPDPGRIRVLFQGLLAPGRGIEALLRSVPLWRPEFHLVLRGPAGDAYRAELEALAGATGAGARIVFDPPRSPGQLVEAANEADIGIHPLEPVNRNNRLALPNKIFEYLMAGLAVCVSDLPELAAVVRRHDCGRLIGTVTPEAIADAVNGFSPSGIAGAKRNALAAARELCWEREREILIRAYAAIGGGGGALLKTETFSGDREQPFVGDPSDIADTSTNGART